MHKKKQNSIKNIRKIGKILRAKCKTCNKDINITSGKDAIFKHKSQQFHIKGLKVLQDNHRSYQLLEQKEFQKLH